MRKYYIVKCCIQILIMTRQRHHSKTIYLLIINTNYPKINLNVLMSSLPIAGSVPKSLAKRYLVGQISFVRSKRWPLYIIIYYQVIVEAPDDPSANADTMRGAGPVPEARGADGDGQPQEEGLTRNAGRQVSTFTNCQN